MFSRPQPLVRANICCLSRNSRQTLAEGTASLAEQRAAHRALAEALGDGGRIADRIRGLLSDLGEPPGQPDSPR
jgi:hypothetical protein